MTGTERSEQPRPTRFEPPESAAAEPFWAASRDRRLVLQWCRSCDEPIHYPRDACPQCLGDDLEFRPASGRGSIYAVSVMPKPANPLMAGREPYAVALVELEEGVRMMSNIVGVEPDSATIGMAVRITWEPLSDGRNLPQFEVIDSGNDPTPGRGA